MERDDALLEAFAVELRHQRTELGFSQEELAYRAGVNRTYIAKLELARNQPTLRILNQLAGALNCKLPEFMANIFARHQRQSSSSRIPSSANKAKC